jgi:anti-sigma regulatory factor (Ser/Thr protein kinase)
VAAARDFVAGAVDHVGVDVEAVVLLTSEVAANAVRHANSAFDVVVDVDRDRVRVDVVNDSPDLLVIAKEPGPDGGRGTHILDALASRWGVDSAKDNKSVWFECQLQPTADDNP